MLKSDLRKEYKQKRRLLDGRERLRRDDLLLLQFQQLNFTGIQTILTYWPMANHAEPNTHLFNGYLRHMMPDMRFAYPVVQNKTDINAVLINEETVYQTNQWGITEPEAGLEITPTAIDMVLVPLLVFDEKGYRVGYGKGYYDRFLSLCSPNTSIIGFSYFEPIPFISDTHEFDIPLSLGITPQHIYEF